MKRAQRYRIIKAIARQLADDRDEIGLDLYLRAFDVKTPHNYGSFGGDIENYIIGTLADADIGSILEISEDLGLSNAKGGGLVAAPPKIWENSGFFRLFISHISKDKDKASRLRDCLKPYHISGFVAHEDIHPTALWQREIEKGLQTMDAFLAIHTSGFSASVWTQQEIGFAVGRGVKIISLKMGEDPTGFISQHQALPRLNRSAEEIAKEVNALLLGDDLTGLRMNEVVVANLPPREKGTQDVPF